MSDKENELRAAFEEHFRQMPYEWGDWYGRFPEDSAWPGQYRKFEAQCAWEGWQAAWDAAVEASAREVPTKRSAVELAAGGMNAGEWRAVSAILTFIVARIRRLNTEKP